MPRSEFISLTFLGGCIFFSLVNLGHFFSQPATEPQALSRTELRHLVGRTACTFWSVVLLLVGVSITVNLAEPGKGLVDGELYLMRSLASILVLTPSWLLANRITKEPVKAGLLLSMFWSGALFCGPFAGTLNSTLLGTWRKWDRTCYAESPLGLGPLWPYEDASASCLAKVWVEWILTPGLVEESLKFMVLLRLVPTLKDAFHSACLTHFPRSSFFRFMPCCGWFLKLAPSPVVVLLCGVAVGAGFSTMENVAYINQVTLEAEKHGAWIALPRLFSSMLHMSLTGTCAFSLAVSMFSTRGRYFKYLGWLLMVLTHGTFDAFCDFEEADVLEKCSFRASCQLVPPNPLDSEMSGVAKQICNMNRTGSHLLACTCTVDPATKKCSQASTPKQLNPEADHKDVAQLLDFNMSSSSFGGLTAGDDGVEDTEVRNRLYKSIDCARVHMREDDYVCGARKVSWWPEWSATALGCILLLVFSVVGCLATPRLERSFQERCPGLAREPPEVEMSTGNGHVSETANGH